jgi:glycosyltransferase involved in cell wall biosynthesis
MATYNGARFLREQLDSFVRQTRLPDELVVTDDCSTDETFELANEFAREAPFPVRVHRNGRNLGLTRNFETALSFCTGDIIFFSDQDDVWFPEKLATIERHFEQNPSTQVIVNDALLVNERLVSSGNTQLQNILRAAQPVKSFFTGCCSAHRRSWHELALPIPADIPAHDFWINCLAIELGCAEQLTDVLQVFRRHGANNSAWALSNPSGVRFLSLLGMSGLRDARPRWRLRARLLREFLRRVHERFPLASANGWTAELPTIERELANIEQRIRLCSMARVRRTPGVVALWSRGGYGTAAGWKSAVKDLIRP